MSKLSVSRLLLAAIVSTACLAVGAGEVRAQQEPTLQWNFAQAALSIPAKQTWVSADFEFFKRHLSHRWTHFLDQYEWIDAYENGVQSVGPDQEGELFVGLAGVAQAAYQKWAYRHHELSCGVFRQCYGD